MALEEREIANMRSKPRPYKVADGGGLVLLVQPNGAKWWRLRYRINGREKMLSLGTFPDVPLRDARQLRDEARSLIAQGTDPSLVRATSPRQKALTIRKTREKSAALPASTRQPARQTLSAISLDRLKSRQTELSHNTWRRYRWALIRHILPQLGRRSIRSIRAEDILAFVQTAEASDHPETARRVRQTMKQIIRHAVSRDLIDYAAAERLYDELR
jgi:hypothetical protein